MLLVRDYSGIADLLNFIKTEVEEETGEEIEMGELLKKKLTSDDEPVLS